MDDIFCLVDGTTNIDTLVQKFNRAHPSLKFTADSEADNEIVFLHVLLHRQENGSIQRRVFRKKNWTGQYTNFHSFVPLNIKQNLVQGLAARVRRICSPEAIEAELQQLRNTLCENGYPDRFILRNIGERIAKPTVATAEKKDVLIRLPFAGDAASELVRRRFTAAVTKAFPRRIYAYVSQTLPSYVWKVKADYRLRPHQRASTHSLAPVEQDTSAVQRDAW
nr:unnamed protein product [Spirometra erinaceieuropaei]